MSNKIKGKYGEDLAVNYLIKNGYKIIERNYHFSRYGEIDIIALEKAFLGDALCFIEVKTRSSNAFGEPFESITKQKLLKIRKSALNYLPKCPVKFKTFRIDAISVFLTGKDNDTEPEITHLKNIEF